MENMLIKNDHEIKKLPNGDSRTEKYDIGNKCNWMGQRVEWRGPRKESVKLKVNRHYSILQTEKG